MPIWFSGICDGLLLKIATWHKNYDRGDIHSTKDWRDFDGSVKKVIVKRIHRIPFSSPELEHLQRILSDMPLGEEIGKQIGIIKDEVWKNGTLIKGNQRILELAFYPHQVEQMYKLLQACKNAPKTRIIDKAIEENKAGGKDIFEM